MQADGWVIAADWAGWQVRGEEILSIFSRQKLPERQILPCVAADAADCFILSEAYD